MERTTLETTTGQLLHKLELIPSDAVSEEEKRQMEKLTSFEPFTSSNGESICRGSGSWATCAYYRIVCHAEPKGAAEGQS